MGCIAKEPTLPQHVSEWSTHVSRETAIIIGRMSIFLSVAMEFEFVFPKGVSCVEYMDELLVRPKDSLHLLMK